MQREAPAQPAPCTAREAPPPEPPRPARPRPAPGCRLGPAGLAAHRASGRVLVCGHRIHARAGGGTAGRGTGKGGHGREVAGFKNLSTGMAADYFILMIVKNPVSELTAAFWRRETVPFTTVLNLEGLGRACGRSSRTYVIGEPCRKHSWVTSELCGHQPRPLTSSSVCKVLHFCPTLCVQVGHRDCTCPIATLSVSRMLFGDGTPVLRLTEYFRLRRWSTAALALCTRSHQAHPALSLRVLPLWGCPAETCACSGSRQGWLSFCHHDPLTPTLTQGGRLTG